MDNLKGLIKKVKMPDAIQDAFGAAGEKTPSLKAVNRALEERKNEKAKIFGFIGMEVYDRFSRDHTLEIAQIQNYLDKMDIINREIQELEHQKKELEVKNAGKNICACGYKLKPQDRFCTNCGEVISKASLICVCGAKLNKGAKFCGACGRSVEEPKTTEPGKEKSVKKCICGAFVPDGQFICFECGRKIE